MEFLAQFHPPIVHFAIALVISAVVFDIVGFVLKKEMLNMAGLVNLVFSLIFVWGASITGHQAEELVEEKLEGSNAYSLLEIHEGLGEFIPWIVLLFVAFRVFIYVKNINVAKIAYMIAGLAIITIIIIQGGTGGKLVYQYGVGVDKCIKNLDTHK